MNYFTEAEAAARYAQHRPKVHAIIKTWLADALGRPQPHFKSAIDIACGTGDSTIPLFELAESVCGIDASPEMLKYAREKGIEVAETRLETFQTDRRFDLLTTCMAFHWFDPAEAIPAFKRLSQPGAIWLIYNFRYGGPIDNEPLRTWFRADYLKRFPSPPRNRYSNVIPKGDPELRVIADADGVIPLLMSAEALVKYLMTQSNVEHAVKNGRPYAEIEAELIEAIRPFDLSGGQQYRFTYEIVRFEPDQSV